MAHQILRLLEVIDTVKLSRSSIYLRISKDEFPAPISLGGRAVGWLEDDIQNWLDERIKVSKGRKHA